MDPNANLEEQRRIAAHFLNEHRPDDPSGDVMRAERLAELVRALDEWLSHGGFPPRAWVPKL